MTENVKQIMAELCREGARYAELELQREVLRSRGTERTLAHVFANRELPHIRRLLEVQAPQILEMSQEDFDRILKEVGDLLKEPSPRSRAMADLAALLSDLAHALSQ